MDVQTDIIFFLIFTFVTFSNDMNVQTNFIVALVFNVKHVKTCLKPLEAHRIRT